MRTYRDGDRVLVIAAPMDVRGRDGSHLFTNRLPGKIVGQLYEYMGEATYKVVLDEPLLEAEQYGWVSNHFSMAADCFVPDEVTSDELDEVFLSIQAAVQKPTQ